ncbi:Putative transposable element, partial [Caligus rogercresseyi]
MMLGFMGSDEATYGHNGYIWSQDGAPAHTSKAIQKYLKNKLGSTGFQSKEMWPPSSPNLNPLDFSIWQHIENKACGVYHSNISDLKAT